MTARDESRSAAEPHVGTDALRQALDDAIERMPLQKGQDLGFFAVQRELKALDAVAAVALAAVLTSCCDTDICEPPSRCANGGGCIRLRAIDALTGAAAVPHGSSAASQKALP